ncbi:MAG: hypothetical protein IJU93_08915 [Lachnospiraceae bacterium]|nr:hypothetical protein [Lachnospiraceae bacterium]
MLKQEVVDEIRIAIYEDLGVLYDIYAQKWSDELLKEMNEYVPGITQADLEEYRSQDAPYIVALLKLGKKVGSDETLMNSLFEKKPEEAYETVKSITGDAIPYDDFVDILEYGGKPFFKAFEGAKKDEDELSEDDLDEVAGGIDSDTEKTIVAVAEKVLDGLGALFHCFTVDSCVDTPKGCVPIQDVKEGDIVFSLDENGNRIETRVTGTTRGEGSVIEVHFENGKVWNTTSTQWFYDGKLFHDVWQHKDHDVVTLEGATKINDIVETGKKQVVYDLIMDGTNIMFIDGIAAEGYGA